MLRDFADFWITYFATYDITTEVVVLVVITILLAIIAFTKPEPTFMMRLIMLGIHFAVCTIICHIGMLGATITMRKSHSYTGFYIWYILFSIFYTLVLNTIFFYISQLSFRRRSQKKYLVFMTLLFTAIYFTILFTPLFEGNLLAFEDGIYSLTLRSDLYVWNGFLCSLFCFLAVISNQRDVPLIVNRGSGVFVIVCSIGCLAQFYFHTAYFICATYAMPFFVFYLLFHVHRFDEVIGCQNKDAELNHVARYLEQKKDFIVFSFRFPKLEYRNLKEIRDITEYAGNILCRQFEKVKRGIRIYKISNFQYDIVAPVKNEQEFADIEQKLEKIILEPVNVRGVKFETPVDILVSGKMKNVDSVEDYFSILQMKKREFTNPDIGEKRYVTEDDCVKYKKQTIIERNLIDIGNQKNLDDERVQVFIQPIYCIQSDTFRTGESLMRLKLDGQMVFPDQFIPIAEDIGCIHALTRIMIHKVAKKTIELAKNRDFDAITVNVSTVEMTDPNASKEFYDLITETGADPKHIRLEITESTTISDYETIIQNIKQLNEQGIQFYLDDFGTGYSNMERISNIPFRTIKFDKSLLYKALVDRKSAELFTVLLNYFKKNGFYTVIEGVEDEQQKEYVKNVGFDYIQGYYYSKPVPAEQINDFFTPVQMG